MGLLSNLRVLATSDVGSVVRELRNRIIQLEADIDEVRELSESRFRRLRKRQSDDQGVINGSASPQGSNPRLDRLVARRAARAARGSVAG